MQKYEKSKLLKKERETENLPGKKESAAGNKNQNIEPMMICQIEEEGKAFSKNIIGNQSSLRTKNIVEGK